MADLADIFAGAVGSGLDPKKVRAYLSDPETQNAITGGERVMEQARPPPSLLTSMGVSDEFNDKLADTNIANFGPGMVKSLANVFTLPGDAWNQKVDPMSGEGVDRAVDWAATMAGGGAATAGMRETGLGIFGGRMAKTADLKALAKAEKMDIAGRLKHEIYRDTGWFKDADGQWRFEISDHASRIDSKAAMDKRVAAHGQDTDESFFASVIAHRARDKGLSIDDAATHLSNELGGRPIPARSIELARANTPADLRARYKYLEGYDPTAAPLTVDEVVHHPELKAAYPNLFTRPYQRIGGLNAYGFHGAYSPPEDKLFFSKFSNEPEWGTALHELQHAIQAREGFAPGANSGDWSPAAKLKYKNSAGEVESRNVELRKKLTAAERKIKFPWMTQDVKPNKVFVEPPDPFRPKP